MRGNKPDKDSQRESVRNRDDRTRVSGVRMERGDEDSAREYSGAPRARPEASVNNESLPQGELVVSAHSEGGPHWQQLSVVVQLAITTTLVGKRI